MTITDFYLNYVNSLPKSDMELVITKLRCINTNDIKEQYDKITDIVIEFSLNWDFMIRLEDEGYIKYDEEYECFKLGDNYD